MTAEISTLPIVALTVVFAVPAVVGLILRLIEVYRANKLAATAPQFKTKRPFLSQDTAPTDADLRSTPAPATPLEEEVPDKE